jgi:hypothetical protein
MVTERRGRRRIEGWGRGMLAGMGMAVPGCGGQPSPVIVNPPPPPPFNPIRLPVHLALPGREADAPAACRRISIGAAGSGRGEGDGD